jgi:hypothetical protein
MLRNYKVQVQTIFVTFDDDVYNLKISTFNFTFDKNVSFIKIVVYLTSSFVNWALYGMSGPVETRGKRAKKKPNLHTNELNTTFFCSTSLLKAPNCLKSLKLA